MTNSNGPGGFGGQPPRPFQLEDLDFGRLARFARLIFLALIILAVLMGLNWGRKFYTDWLWFSGLGYEQVLFVRVITQVWIFLLAFLAFIALAAPNFYAAYRHTGQYTWHEGRPLSTQRYQSARKLLLWLGILAILIGGIVLAMLPSSQWETFLRFFNGVAFNESDPVFGRDLSFYVFTLPVLDFIRAWLMGVVVLILIFTSGIYYISAGLKGEILSFEGRFRNHVLVLGSLIFLMIAAGHWLGRYELLFSKTGAVFGVSYTDAHVTLPARTILTFVAIACAATLLASVRSRGYRLISIGIGTWLVLSLLGIMLLPGVVQRLQLEPSELAREREYLAENTKNTRKAYGLEDMVSKDHPALGDIKADTVKENRGTIRNLRFWDEKPLLQSYNQIQFFRLYYDFLSVQTDRYMVDGELRQVMLSTRELSSEKLPSEAQRWVNRHLQFTHGYGVTMSPVTEVAEGGRPKFFLRDVPPEGKIKLERPEIYYGLKSLPFTIVNSGMKEFNYPGKDGPVYTHYAGKGGVKLDSFFKKFLYAWQFKDLNILISGEINPDSRIQYRRTVAERFETVTPFLKRDQEAYTVVADGRQFFIQDAYTVTNRYPYSTPWQRKFNYISNSVKTVVDMYNGTMNYYVFDESCPIIQTYMEIYPELFKPADQMPDYLQDHVRYPMDLFNVQSRMLLQYHMTDPVVFYNKEDQWSVPQHASAFGGVDILRPYYIMARLPGEEKEEFLLIQPFTPDQRHNLVGWMAARMDGENYGEKILYNFPSGRHVDGPRQVEARIDNDAVISEQFTLWGQVGSEVMRGDILVIPLGSSLLYAEPVFLKPEALEFPELRRIILADSRKVVMHPTLEDAVDALVGRKPTVAPPVKEEKELDKYKKDMEAREPGVEAEGLEAVRKGLQEAIDQLQEVADQLNRMERRENP
ncbi:MAG: UPF0182 family protein [Desulfobacteraceae bacterium]|nr:UPF0182 family protein [Desulfobacteraceae bacterium]